MSRWYGPYCPFAHSAQITPRSRFNVVVFAIDFEPMASKIVGQND